MRVCPCPCHFISSTDLVSVGAKSGTIGDFELSTKVKDDKVYSLRAASSALRDEWVSALQSVIGDSGSECTAATVLPSLRLRVLRFRCVGPCERPAASWVW